MADNKTKAHTSFYGLTKKGPRHPLQQKLDPDANVTSPTRAVVLVQQPTTTVA